MNIPEGFVLVPADPIKAIDMGWAYLDAAREAEPNKSHSFSHDGYRAMVAAAPPVELPAYDEAKERELFTAFAMEHFLNIHRRDNGDYFYTETRIAWAAWKSCAKSRARSAE